ncbi:ATP-binding protein, partial [Escherichia coli]|uniref:ATP-binding protein n=1 Tax=Escherichia coli TaxID=562 RepID=UPI0028DEACC8|nr:sensor histidine kinase [Escherichia coli]
LDSSGHPASLEVVGAEREVQTRAAQNLVRIAQEALTNATKHAPGAGVWVSVSYEVGVVALEVGNDAPSRPGATPDTGSGMGLIGMR